MTAPWSYLLCATPRTGSTLLCSLLASTGVAGRPESYFREPDERVWAARFGVPVAGDGSFDYRAFAAGAAQAGSTHNGVFAARIMWGTMHLVVDGLRADGTVETDLGILTDTFGPLRMVHLHRDDVVGQATSWARAEQTGYWQSGDVPSREPAIDLDQVDGLVRTIEGHNAAWTRGSQVKRGAASRELRGSDRRAGPGCPQDPQSPRHRTACRLATTVRTSQAGR